MLKTKVPGKEYHEKTNHSYMSVKIDPNYVDSSTQPCAYKVYPHFYRRYPLEDDNSIHDFIKLASAITLEKDYKNYSVQLRAIPSAGGLYPTELYVQIRGIEGVINGLYHVEVATNTLTLVYELIDDGLEAYICPGKTIQGLIFLVTCVYFRSSWKYKERSLRYCFLDSGHHLGAIAAAGEVHSRNVQFIFDFDKLALNADLGLENKEFVTACAISGSAIEKPRRRFRLTIPFVAGTDYFEPSPFIEKGYRETLGPTSERQPLVYPEFKGDRQLWRQTIWQRRSARHFRKGMISAADFLEITREISQPFATESFEDIEIYNILHRVEGMEAGIYRGTELVKAGDFSERTGYLCVEQRIARDSAVTLFIVSDYRNYQTASQLAGVIGQRLYLASNYRGIDCTGIGAYYDEETKEFLGTDKDVVYAMTIGN